MLVSNPGHWLIFYFLECASSILALLSTFYLYRSGQTGVPAEPWEPGNLPESLWPDWALLQHWRWGSIFGSSRRPAAAAVPLPAVRGPDGGLPAIMLIPPFSQSSTFILTFAPVSLYPHSHDPGWHTSASPSRSPSHCLRGLIIIMIIKSIPLKGHTLFMHPARVNSAVLSASSRFHSFCLLLN